MSAAPSEKYHRTRLFTASCIALVTTAMAFSIRTDVLAAFGTEFNIGPERQGYINLAGIWGFPIAILIFGPLVDMVGMRRLLGLACLGHIAGVVFTILSPSLGGYAALLAATLVIGLSNGIVEAVINPLVATLYPQEKTHKLNVLHAWWPGGLIIGGLIAFGLEKFFGFGWQVKIATILLAAVLYGVLILGQEFPPTERTASGVSTGDMFKEVARPGFLLLLFCMLLTAVTELGPDQWVGPVLTDTVGIKGVLFLVYTAGLMFVLRFFAGPIAHRISPLGLLWVSALLSGAGLFALSYAFTPVAAIIAATIFGVGKTYFWPTMLGVASERYPRGGSLALAMMGAGGMFAAGLAGPILGGIYERGIVEHLPAHVQQQVVVDGKFQPQAAEALKQQAETNAALAGDVAALAEARRNGGAIAFRSVTVLPAILLVLFGGMFLYYRQRGGYRPVQITEDSPAPG